MCFHGSAISFDESGIIFSGPSGAGKSTQANLWKKYLYSFVINYDKPLLLRSKARYYVCGAPWSGKENCYNNISERVKAIVVVKKRNKNYVKSLSAVEAFSQLYPNYMPYPISDEIRDLFEKSMHDICIGVPVYELYCTPNESAVEVLYQELWNDSYLKRKKREKPMKIKEEFVIREIAGEHIAFNKGAKETEKNISIILNDTGLFLWNLLLNSSTES